MRSKIIWKWVLTGALGGVFLFHPIVMITDYFMREPLWVHGQSILDVILHETLLTFNLKMILWNLSLAVLGALVGFFCGRTKQAKKALREVEGKYQELAESISDVFFAMDNNLRYTYWNKASEILTGIPAEKAVGKTLMEVFPDNEAREQVKKMYLRVIETKKPEHLIVTYPGNEQIVHEINTYPTREGVSIFINDITSRNQAEEALRESEERYRILFESSRDAIMTLAPPTWLFTSGNPATIELFRVKDEAEFISLGPGQLSPERQPDDKSSYEKAKEMIETAMRNGSHFFEWTHCHSDGSPFSAEVLLTRMEQRGQVLLQATVRDITEHKQAEEQRDRLILDIQKALSEVKTLRGFLPICSHCKKIRDDKGYWNQIESYIRDRSDAEFSHGICPECAQKYYPDMDLYEDTKRDLGNKIVL